MRSSLLSLSLLLLPLIASADWQQYPNSGCIGGSRCPDRSLRVKLEDRPIVAIRFHAHDSVGESAGGELRVRIDGNTIRGSIDIPRAGETFTIDVDELSGQYLIFEPDENDEVMIERIAVNYSNNTLRRLPRKFDDRDDRPSGGGWRSYDRDAQCIGGSQCRQNGNRITIALESFPILGIRFRAHDNVGSRAEGLLNIRIDDHAVASYVDVKREGMRHEYDVNRIRGSRLVISTANDDEVEVSNIEVLYARDRGRGDGGGYGGGGFSPRDTMHEGGCIGGSECGGRRSRIRVPLRDRGVSEIRFYARDDVGARAGGKLRVRIDDEVIRDYIDIPREGRTFTIDARGLEGEYVVIEPAEDDEVVVKDIRVKYE